MGYINKYFIEYYSYIIQYNLIKSNNIYKKKLKKFFLCINLEENRW